MAVDTPVRRSQPDLELYKACKSRITDYYEHNADTIRAKRTVSAAACIFDEMRRLCHEVRRQDAAHLIPEPARFEQAERYVARVCEDHAGAITTGQFVKINAAVFGLYRYLVRAVEAVLKRLLDVEEQYALGEYVPDVHKARIELDLDESLAEDKPILSYDGPPKAKKPRKAAEDDDSLPT